MIGAILAGIGGLIILFCLGVWLKALTDYEPDHLDRICYGCTRAWCDLEPGGRECQGCRNVPWEKGGTTT